MPPDATSNSGLMPSGRGRRDARLSVLQAASQVFVERGFEGASIDLIAQRAGVSKPTIYSHFAGKEELFVEILNQVCDNLAAPMVEDGAQSEDLETVLLRIADTYAKTVLRPEVIALHRLFVAEAERFPELSRRYFEAGPDRAHRSFADFLKVRMKKGEIRNEDPLALAELFAAMIVNPLRMKLLFAVTQEVDRKALDRYCRLTVRLFLRGCAVPTGSDATGVT